MFNLPTNLKLDGTGFKYCPATKITADQSPAKCPKGSKIGSGTAVAYAGSARLDYVISIYAGSKNEIALYLAGNTPLPALRGVISDAGLQYGQKITIDIPEQVQKPIPNLYSAITETHAKIGPASGKKTVTKRVRGKKRRVKVKTYFVQRTGCPSNKTQAYGVRLRFVPNPNQPPQGGAEAKATQTCKS